MELYIRIDRVFESINNKYRGVEENDKKIAIIFVIAIFIV